MFWKRDLRHLPFAGMIISSVTTIPGTTFGTTKLDLDESLVAANVDLTAADVSALEETFSKIKIEGRVILSSIKN